MCLAPEDAKVCDSRLVAGEGLEGRDAIESASQDPVEDVSSIEYGLTPISLRKASVAQERAILTSVQFIRSATPSWGA